MMKRLMSFKYAFEGLHYLFKTQPNAKIHILLGIAACILGWWLAISIAEWAILVLTIILVFAAEAFNTSIEALTDLASPDIHPLAKIAKDVAAAAVLITAM
jgi:diacylglycerol kinase (ATP)